MNQKNRVNTKLIVIGIILVIINLAFNKPATGKDGSIYNQDVFVYNGFYFLIWLVSLYLIIKGLLIGQKSKEVKSASANPNNEDNN